MHRFFVPGDWIQGNNVTLTGEHARQILSVLRLKPPEHIIALDNSGLEFEVEIENTARETVRGRIVRKDPGAGEPSTRITLYQALLKSDKFELVLQKGVELGVGAFVPFISERCVVGKPGESKVKRWDKIIREAAEQSGRAVLPPLRAALSFEDACKPSPNPAILLWEEEKQVRLHQALKSPPFQNARELNIFIGPEGGFPASEVEYAKSLGIAIASLGARVLRAETAGLAVISAVLYEKGELV